jgi:hypothetical protein
MVFEISTSNCICILQQFTSFSVYNLVMATMGGPKHVVVARLPSLAIKIQYSCVYDCFFTLIFYIVT